MVIRQFLVVIIVGWLLIFFKLVHWFSFNSWSRRIADGGALIFSRILINILFLLYKLFNLSLSDFHRIITCWWSCCRCRSSLSWLWWSSLELCKFIFNLLLNRLSSYWLGSGRRWVRLLLLSLNLLSIRCSILLIQLGNILKLFWCEMEALKLLHKILLSRRLLLLSIAMNLCYIYGLPFRWVRCLKTSQVIFKQLNQLLRVRWSRTLSCSFACCLLST